MPVVLAVVLAVLAQSPGFQCPPGTTGTRVADSGSRDPFRSYVAVVYCRAFYKPLAPILPTPTPKRTPTPAPTATSTPSPSPSPTPTATPTASGPAGTPTPTPPGILLGSWYHGEGPGGHEDAAAQQLSAAGIEVARVRLFWPESSSVEPWAWWDPVIAMHSGAGRLVLLEWWDWRPPYGRHLYGDCSTSPMGEYAAFAADIAERYADDLYAVQPENETDACEEPGITADRIEAMRAALDAHAPDVLLVAPGLAYDNFRFSDRPPGYPGTNGPFRYSHLGALLGALSAKACAPCVDAWALHRYPGFPFWGSVAAKAADVRSRLAPYGWAAMPLWATEIGAPAWGGAWTPDAQAAWVLADCESARDADLAACIGYSTLDEYPQLFGFFDVWGGPTPRPVVPTLEAMPR